jgi:membrane protein
LLQGKASRSFNTGTTILSHRYSGDLCSKGRALLSWLRRFAVLDLWPALVNLSSHGGFELAGHMAFMALLSIFPFLVFLAALAGFFGNARVADTFIDLMFDFLPPDVSHVLAPAVREVLTNRQGGLLTFGLVTAIWAASSGIEALRTALNHAYQIAEPRPIWYLRLQSIAMVFLAAFAVMGLSITVIFGPILLNLVEKLVWVPEGYRVLWQIGRYVIGAVLTTGLVTVLHGWLPRARQRWRDILPGALATTVLWLLTANLFSIYLGTVGSYSATYGSLGGIVITLLFLYVTSLIFIFGAELNALLRRRHAGEACPIPLDAVHPRR